MKTEPTQLIHSFNHTADTEGNFNGLTKREYFAAMAMQGMLANHVITDPFKYVAQNSLIMADELINELNKGALGCAQS